MKSIQFDLGMHFKSFVSRVLSGAAAGAFASFPLVATKAAAHANFLVGIVIGAGFAAGLGRMRRAHIEVTLAACAL